jgi:AcrR family transcriptional regulator
MKEKNILRHKPVQKRSRSRVEDILKSAEYIFNERGYEASTTNAIADKAGIPIGSLYQYFKNKKAILDSLSEKYTSELKELFAGTFAKELQDCPLEEMSDRMLDDLAKFYAKHTAFQVVLYGASRTSDLDNASDELRQHIIGFIVQSIQRRTPEKSAENIRTVSTMLVAIARSILPAAISSDGKINSTILNELKIAIKSYLHATLQVK